MHPETHNPEDAGRSTVSCPNCGHDLSMFEETQPEPGERFATRVAGAVASPWFPLALFVGIITWLTVNVVARPFEPYPMIVVAGLAAALSTIAACQGPLILLTQRRAADRDRARDRETYMVAANAEADLHHVKQRLDELIETVNSLTPRSSEQQDREDTSHQTRPVYVDVKGKGLQP